MTARMFNQSSSFLRSSFADRCGPVQHFIVAAILAVSAPVVLLAADDDDSDNSMRGLCELSGGTFTISGDGSQRCCWDNWGCLECNSSNDSNCLMECDTAPCCISNGGCNVVQGPQGPVIADPGGEPGRPDFDQLEADDSPVAVDDGGQYTPIGDDVGNYTPIGDVLGNYTPIGDMVEIFVAVAPDFRREDLESLDVEGTLNDMCGASGGGSLVFGMMGFIGLVGTQRGRRNIRSANQK